MDSPINNIQFNPKNSFIAIIYFIFGMALVWWSHDKITAFSAVFSNNIGKIIIWTLFIFLYALWILFVPYLCLTGKTVTVWQFLRTFEYGLGGALLIILILPIIQTIMDGLSIIFSNTILSGIVWFVVFVIIGYVAFYKPIEVLYDVNT